MPRRAASLTLSVFLLLGAAPFAAQTQPPANLIQAPSPGPVFRTNARDVIVDVVATDSKGNAVPGLRASDFKVFEDGKPQTIDFFEEHTAKTLPPGALEPLPAMPPNVYTNVPPAPESDSVNILLFDTLNTPVQSFDYARLQVIKFLHNIAPGTRMAIVSLSDKLTFVQGFTTDASTLLTDMEKKKRETPSAGGPAAFGATTLIDAYGNNAIFQRQGLNRARMTLEALQYLARYLANVPGRKNLIWFSTSFPVYIFPNLGEMGAREDLLDAEIRKTADALTAARIAVYPVGAGGMMNDSMFNADQSGAGSMRSLMGAASRRADIMTSMEQLAADTGGKAIFNNNDLAAATARDIQDGSHYYTLAYSPTNKKLNGRMRAIKIETTQGEYKLAYRRGYYADDPAAGHPAGDFDPLHAIMLLGMPQSTEILYGLRVVPAPVQPAPGAPRAGKNDKLSGPVTRLSLDFLIRWSDVHFSPIAKGKEWGRIQCELLAYDAGGTALNWIGGTQEMQLDPATYASVQHSGIPAHLEIDVPQGKDIYLSSGVYDWRTRKAGTLQIHLPQESAAAKPAPSPSPSAK